ncbi:tetratricopeptide repeat protein [Desulforamulus ruminis]|uniref:tetratricopeptide repeat protein n=1 Tax=Desulforamulus ruminis TaxID=1564 RepID=UPI002353E3FA|nr:tetratricopeptide repeat protein [Desulforamulus ruminis]
MVKSIVKKKNLYQTKRNLQGRLEVLHWIIITCLVTILFIAPFLKGLFFAQEQRCALLAVSIVFLLAYLRHFLSKDQSLTMQALDYFIFALPVVYFITSFTAVNHQLAIDSLIQNLLYVLLYWTFVLSINSIKDIKIILNTVYISALLVAMAGIMTATGLIDIKDGFLNQNGGMIASTLQYKNALASFLTASLIMGIYFVIAKTQIWLKTLYIMGNSLLILVLFCTQSHGGYINLGLFLLLFMMAIPIGRKIKTGAYLVLTMVTGFLSAELVLNYIGQQEIIMAWLVLLLCVIVNGAVYLVCHKNFIMQQFKNEKINRLTLVAGVLFLSFVSMVFIFVNPALLTSFWAKLHMHGALERITMYQDAWRMFLDRPILGWGGGGWSEVYRVYQSYFYISRQPHSYFLQVLIETGIIGFGIVLGIWISLLNICYNLFCLNKEDENKKLFIMTLFLIIGSLGAHAVIDFNLSLSALSMILYTFFAILRWMLYKEMVTIKDKKEEQHFFEKFKMTVVSISCIGIILFTITLISSEKSIKQALVAINQGNGEQALKFAEKAVKSNPLNPEYYLIKGQLLYAQGNKEEAISMLEEAISKASFNPKYYALLADYYFMVGEQNAAIVSVNKVIELAPLNASSYEPKAKTYTNLGIEYLQHNDQASAREKFSSVLKIPQEMQQRFSSVPERKRQLWNKNLLVETRETKLNIGKCYYFLGELDSAQEQLIAASNHTNKKVKEEAYLWLAAVNERLGNSKRKEIYLNAVRKADLEAESKFEDILKLPLIRLK